MSTTAIEGREYPNDQVVRDFVCAACGGELREFWGETRKGDWVVCLTSPTHRGFVKRMTAWVEERKEALVETKQTTALVATEQEVEIERWAKRMDRLPLAGPQDKVKLIKYATARMAVIYGLDPFLGELVIIPHKKDGQVTDLSLYASIGGMRRVARRTEEYEGRELNPATKKERQDFKITDDNVHVWKCLVYRKGYPRPFDGFGIFPMLKQDQYSPANPALMARKRAEHQALRAAFDLNIPLFEPEIEEEKPFEFTVEEAPLLNARQAVEEANQRLQALIDEAGEIGVPDVEIVQALEETTPPEAAETSEEEAEALKEELYGLQEPEMPEEKTAPEEVGQPPSVALYWQLVNENDVALVFADSLLQATRKEGRPVIEAIEALQVHIEEKKEGSR